MLESTCSIHRPYSLNVPAHNCWVQPGFQKIRIPSDLFVRSGKSMRLSYYPTLHALHFKVEPRGTGPGRDRPWSTGIPSSVG